MRLSVRSGLTVLAPLAVALCTAPATAEAQGPRRPAAAPAAAASFSPDSFFAQLPFRAIGPINMHGRATDVEGVTGNADYVYVGTAAGGLWKTTNGGTSWKSLFDAQPTLSIGDLALDPTNSEVVYAGTGEANLRNSVSFGRGMYKTTDGGATWKFLGLGDTRHIARVLVNPKDPKVVFVCAVGHMSGPNAERGVFRSTDAGETWTKVLYLDDRHGCADLDVDPVNPNMLYASLWYFDRKQWKHTSGDTLSGIWRSADGGTTWTKTTRGLPKLVGRIGLKVAASQPNTVYAAVESNEAILYRSDDYGQTWVGVNREKNLMCRGFYYADLRVDPTNPDRVWMIGCALSWSIDGGRTFRRVPGNVHGDHHGLWQDPADAKRVWQVNDGGVYASKDGGNTWEHANGFPLSQLYQLHADNREPFYNITMGLQDNGNWTGPSRTKEPAGILADDWKIVSYGDGYYSVSHPDDPDVFLTDQQGGWIYRTNMRTMDQSDVSPQPRRADGAPVNTLQYRFNWNAPIFQSPHDGKVVYFGAQVLFRSKDFGSTWESISPDLSKDDKSRQGEAGGAVWTENTTAEYYANIYEIAESPVAKGVLWVGTDDGNLQISENDGRTWTNVVGNLPGLAPDGVISALEPSRTGRCTAYAGAERHFMDDYKPYVFKTTDCGKTWKSVAANLPDMAYVLVIREDRKNPNVLYVGTEIGLFVSLDGGQRWWPVRGRNLPATPVHEVLVHPRENDLLVATHGRGVFILDDASVVQQVSQEIMDKRAHLFGLRTATRVTMKGTKGNIGDRVFRGPNPPMGALITYSLANAPDSGTAVRVDILDADRKVIRTIPRAPRAKGMNRVVWGLDENGPRPRNALPVAGEEFFGPIGGPRVLPGTYTVRLVVGPDTMTQPVTVRVDPTIATTTAALTQQLVAGRQLRDMQSAVNDTLRALDGFKAQLEARKRAADGQPNGEGREQSRAIASVLAEVNKVISETVKPTDIPFYSEGPRVADRIGALLRQLGTTFDAPTGPQMKLVQELEVELKQALQKAAQALGKPIM
jgi:photosystem II stability/assembly factor-like uncharacterized protein